MFDITSLLFASFVLQAAYLIKRAFQPPNPDPKNAPKADRLANPTYLVFLTLYSNATAIVGVIHALFTLFPSTAQDFCPNPSSVNPDLFAWSLPTIALITISLFGGYLRLVAYSQLQENFTFRLARPSRLMQSGVYGWIQHPSYSGALLLIFCYCGVVLRRDGVLSCWMGSLPLAGLVYGNWIFLVVAVIVTFPPRIATEEKMLHDGFGTEWEDYHRRTARFIPFIF